MDTELWKPGDKMEVRACDGHLVLKGHLAKVGMYMFFISEDRGPLKKPWHFRVSIVSKKVLWFDGSVDSSVEIKRIE